MQNKIIGFLITFQKSNPEIDFFQVGLKIKEIKWNNFYIYLWGFGEIEKCKIKNKYSLSFPLHDNLLDRNLLISLEEKKITIENDWLGAIPVFYNFKEKIISTIPNFCLVDKSIHPEGLNNFFEFGFSVFEQTPFRDVQFMRYYSKITLGNELKIVYKKDPVLENDFLSQESKEEEVIEKMKKYVEEQEQQIDNNIFLPLSGGYDSRLLAYLVKDKSRIKSFTYGINANQSKSEEVVRAKKIAEIYNIDWKQIKLENYFKKDYINKWFKFYGFSTHLHGMDLFEFLEKVLKYSKSLSLLSGIHGGLYTGQVGKYKEVKNYKDIINLSFNHNLCVNEDYLLETSSNMKKNFFKEIIDFIENDKIKSIFTVRIKGMLISYLTTVPEYFKIPVWTPFLSFDIIKSIVNIPEHRRNNRIWKRDFFKKVGLNVEDMGLKSSKFNVQSFEIARKSTFEPIDVPLMKKYINEKRLVEINEILSKKVSIITIWVEYLSQIRGFGRLLRALKINNKFLRALTEWQNIKAIEKSLKL